MADQYEKYSEKELKIITTTFTIIELKRIKEELQLAQKQKAMQESILVSIDERIAGIELKISEAEKLGIEE